MTSSSLGLASLKTVPMTSNMHSFDSDSSCSSSDSPTTPTSSQTLSRVAFSIGSGTAIPSSSSDDGSQSSDGSASTPDSQKELDEIEPVFSSIPTRRAKSSGAIARPSASPFACHAASNAMQSAPTVPPRRTPSFPVSKPIRPFDSISNAMGTNNKRVSPILSRVEASTAIKGEKPASPKSIEPQQLEFNSKPKRSNILLEPPKKSRFQNGFFILDMTQEEFKSRAW